MQPRRQTGQIQSHKILLWVFTGHVLGVWLVVEREIWAVVLFDALHFLVPVRFSSPVEESGGYGKAGHHHKDHHRYDACEAGDSRCNRLSFISIHTNSL